MEGPSFCYPVLCFQSDFVRLRLSWDALTTTTKAGLKNGYFRNLLIVDSNGQAIRVKDARKLHGVGLFAGYNVFLNQRIKVELETEGQPFTMSPQEVKERILNSFTKWHGWESRGDFEELQEKVRKAQTAAELNYSKSEALAVCGIACIHAAKYLNCTRQPMQPTKTDWALGRLLSYERSAIGGKLAYI